MSLTSYRAALPRSLFLVKRRMKVSDFRIVARGKMSFFRFLSGGPAECMAGRGILDVRGWVG